MRKYTSKGNPTRFFALRALNAQRTRMPHLTALLRSCDAGRSRRGEWWAVRRAGAMYGCHVWSLHVVPMGDAVCHPGPAGRAHVSLSMQGRAARQYV